MGADYSFYVKNIETHARAFLTLNIFAIGRVLHLGMKLPKHYWGKMGLKFYKCKHIK